jgi:hypothetical protein
VTSANDDQRPSTQDVQEMLQRMHNAAAADCSNAGWHAASAKHEQAATKYRNAANGK